MIKSTRLLVVDKTDIQRQGFEKSVTEWSHTDLRQKSHELLATSDLVIAVGDKGKTTILKSRWGMTGVVISHEDYKEFIKLRYENNKPGTLSKIKSFLAMIFGPHAWPFN